jgi:hypothetical protein
MDTNFEYWIRTEKLLKDKRYQIIKQRVDSYKTWRPILQCPNELMKRYNQYVDNYIKIHSKDTRTIKEFKAYQAIQKMLQGTK